MAKRQTAMEAAVDHAKGLPEFDDADTAREFFFARLMEWRERLPAIAQAAGGPPVQFSLESLRALEQWQASVPDDPLTLARSDREELAFLIQWHAAATAVRCVPHVEWVVQESSFVPGRWEFGVRSGLMTQFLSLSFSTEPPARSRRAKSSWTDWVEMWRERVAGDPTLHPSVLANRDRLSTDHRLRHCQTLALAHGVDAFDESSLLAELKTARGSRLLEAIRCLEPFPSLSDSTIAELHRIAEKNGTDSPHAIGLVLRHRPGAGLGLAERHCERISEYSFGPIVDAVVSIHDLQATAVLACAVRKISERKHPLWQASEAFALAVGRLWASARNGDLEAQGAIKMIGRRWKRIPPETLESLRRTARGLTQAVAKSGGVGGRNREQ